MTALISRWLKKSVVWEWVIGVCGIVVVGFQIPQLAHLPVLEILILILLGITLEMFPVNVGKAQGSLMYIMPLALVVSYSPAAAICVTACAELAVPLRRDQRKKFSTWLFNAGQYALSAYVMSLVYERLAGSGTRSTLNWDTLLPLLVAMIVFLVVNHFFIHFVYWLRDRFEARDVLHLIITDGVNFLAVIPFVLLFIIASGPYPRLAPTFMLPVVLVSQVVRMYRNMANLREVHTELLKLTGEFDVDTISEHIAQTAYKLTYADAVGVYIMNDERDTLVPSMFYPTDAAEDFSLGGRHRDEGGVIWAIVDSGMWSYVPNVNKDPRVRYDGVQGKREYLSMAVFPLQTRGHIEGALVLYSTMAYAFGDFIKYTGILATQVSVLIENARLYQQLQEQSWQDGATGLYNYRYLYEELSRRFADAKASSKPLSVAVIDIDSFKKFNDTYGHLAGDAVLRSIGSLLKGLAGKESLVARYGGEEFAIVFPLPSIEALKEVEHIRSEIMRHVVEFDDYHLQGITVSCGLASFPEHTQNDRELLLKADSAMYWGAKQRGRNRTALYSPEFDAQLFVDQLTGLYTHHFANIRVREEMDRGVHQWGILCMDLENFAYINSAFGFDAGDQVLRQTSAILRESLRANELACRFGGDEFLVLLPGVSREELNSISERIQKAIQTQRFQFGTNVVVSVHVRHHGEAFEELVEPGILFEQVGRLFTEMNTGEVTSVKRVF